MQDKAVMVPGREGLADNLMIRTEMRYMHITGGSDGAQRDEGGRHARGALRRRLHGFPIAAAKFCTPDNIALFDKHLECLEKRGDTVGEPISTPYSCDCCVGFSRLLYLQHRHRRGLIFGTGEFANSIRPFSEVLTTSLTAFTAWILPLPESHCGFGTFVCAVQARRWNA
jgi:hypothetical protein